eukprot:TCONS_00019769-protein
MSVVILMQLVLMTSIHGAFYNLVRQDLVLSQTAYKETAATTEQMCISVCSCDDQCFSFAFVPHIGCIFYRSMFAETYKPYPLTWKQGAKFYSAFVKDCSDLYKLGKRENGVYDVHIPGDVTRRRVYCDMSGGWLVFQRRYEGSLDFMNRSMSECRYGFGDAAKEHWLGLEYVFLLTKIEKYELLIKVLQQDGKSKWKSFSNFSVNGHKDKFRFYSTGSYSPMGLDFGTNTMSGFKFTTYDMDGDRERDKNCANEGGPWWYKKCTHNSLNGIYGNPQLLDTVSFFDNPIMAESLVMIRPMGFKGPEIR